MILLTTNLALNSTLLASSLSTGYLARALNPADVLAVPAPNVSYYCSANSDDDDVSGLHSISDSRWAEIWLHQSAQLNDLSELQSRLKALNKICTDPKPHHGGLHTDFKALTSETELLSVIIDAVLNLKYRGDLAAEIARKNGQNLFKGLNIYFITGSPRLPQLRRRQHVTLDLGPYRERPAQIHQRKTASDDPLTEHELASSRSRVALDILLGAADTGDPHAINLLGQAHAAPADIETNKRLLNEFGNWRALAWLFLHRLSDARIYSILNDVNDSQGRLKQNILLDLEKAKLALQEVALYHANIRQLLDEIGIHYEF